tara:strand:- start:30 stop:2489 length:2460 start_codon:yes stop_codon:yes gene_type:complete
MDDIEEKRNQSGDAALFEQPMHVVYDWEMNLGRGIFSCDEEGKKLLFGDVLDNISIKKLIQLVPLQQRETIKHSFQQVLRDGEDRFLQCTLLTPQHLFVYVELAIYRVDEMHLKGTLSPCFIVPSAHEAAEIFYSVFENSHHGVLVTDSETRIMACNRYFEEMTGYLRNEIVGLKTNIFNSSNHDDEYYRELWHSIENKGYWSGVILSRNAKGGTFPQSITIQKISLGKGTEYYLGFCTDLSQEFARIEDMDLGGVDVLTQLPTAESFLNDLVVKCRSIDPNATLLVLAIHPQFDTHSGKKSKQQFASYLKEQTSAAFCGYMEKGRFLACIPVTIDNPSHKVRDIAKSLTTFFHCFKHAPKGVYEAVKSGLLGVSIYGVDATSPSRMISHACQAILELHSGESRRIAFYDHDIHLQIERKKRLEAHVQKAISNEEVEVYFQPIVNVAKQRIEKFEALCRLPPLEGEEVTTDEYIRIAEDVHKVVLLDDMVCSLAFRQYKELKQAFGEHIGLAVNRRLNSKLDVVDVLKHTVKVLDSEEMPPNKLTIEFTESAFLESDVRSHHILKMLRDSGVEIAVDDFGTGCASFHYLPQSYLDLIKIDNRFITNLEPESNEYFTVDTLVKLAHQFKVRVIAEGVETETAFNVARSIGVDYMQGYVFAKPMPIEEILAHPNYLSWPNEVKVVSDQTVSELVNKQSHHLDPGDPLSLAFQYFEGIEEDYLPVVDGKRCVGIVERSVMNLHMTPNMGTDLENSKERDNWNKSVNRMMTPVETKLEWTEPLTCINELIEQQKPFPWVLVDENDAFKGLVELKAVFQFVARR